MDFNLSKAYINNFLMFTRGYWFNQLGELELTPQKMKDNKLKCKFENSFLGKNGNRISRFVGD